MKFASTVPFLHVTDVRRSLAFYELLGFKVENRFEEGGTLNWVWLQNGGASLMLARASEPFDARDQAALVYFYVPDVAACRAELVAKGLTPGAIQTPEHAPRGEFLLA